MIPKFRAFYEDKMYGVKAVIWTSRGLYVTLDEGNKAGRRVHGAVLMQSTGLFDVNGKEIFEGDVVVVLDGMYTVFYDEKTASFRLKPHDKRWHTDYMSNYAHSGSFEVVGNVYQNPELLEEVE